MGAVSLLSRLTLLFAVASISAAATEADVKARLPAGDCMILNYALALEYIEDAFYRESLGRLRQKDFQNARVPDAAQAYRNFLRVAAHESRHVKTLRRTLSAFCGTPLPPCKYNFGVGDVHSFLTVARRLEKLGASAYGGAIALVSNGDIQTAAASIAAVESRHASFLDSASGFGPFPQDFETPLAGPVVVTMAASVIESCPFDIPSTLGAAPFKSLTLVGSAAVRSGRNVRLEYAGSGSGGHFCSFLFSDKSVTVPLDPGNGCRVPKGARGDVFVAVIRRDERLTLRNTQSLIIAGPIFVNVDTAAEESSRLSVPGPSAPHATPTAGHPSSQHAHSSWTADGGGAAAAATTEPTAVIQGSNYPGIPVRLTDFDPLYAAAPDGWGEASPTAGPPVEATGAAAAGDSAFAPPPPSGTLFEVQPTAPAAPAPPLSAPHAAAPVAYAAAVDPAASGGADVAAVYRLHEAPVEAVAASLAGATSAVDIETAGGEDYGGGAEDQNDASASILPASDDDGDGNATGEVAFD